MARKLLIISLILFIIIIVMDKYSFNKSVDVYASGYELSAAEPNLDLTNFPLDMHSIKVRSGVDPSFVNMEF